MGGASRYKETGNSIAGDPEPEWLDVAVEAVYGDIQPLIDQMYGICEEEAKKHHNGDKDDLFGAVAEDFFSLFLQKRARELSNKS